MNPYQTPKAVEEPAGRLPDGEDWLARENAQADVSRLLARGVVFSVIWVLGFGSAYSIYLAARAHRIILRFNGEVRGMFRVVWCYLFGGLGVVIVGSILAVAIWKRLS